MKLLLLSDVVWERARKVIYAEAIQDPISSKLAFASKLKLEKAFSTLPAERRVQVNEALDALCGRLDGVKQSLRSETFKKLAGNPAPPSTHEIYAWSGHGAGRLFGHYEGDKFMIDKLDDHL